MRTPSTGAGPRRRLSAPAACLSFLLVLPTLGVQPLDGQQRGAVPDGVHGMQSRPVALSPGSGPPGTPVTIRGSFLPAITPVQVALGGTQSGFEALKLVLTTRGGELEEVAEIPDWARHDRAHRFIIFDAYFNPLATSGLFHVTDAEGMIQRQGVIEEVSANCVLFMGDDQERYGLVGAGAGLSAGDTVVVEGRFAESRSCGNGLVVQVVRLTPSE